MSLRKKLFRILFGFVALVAVLLLVVTVWGMFLPKQHEFARMLELNQPVDAVWQVVVDFAAQPSWRRDTVRVEPLPPRDGRPTWRITTDHGSAGNFQVVEMAPNSLLILDHQDDNGRSYLEWRFEFAATDSGTRLTLRERGDFGNPYSRFMVRYVLGQTKFVDDYLRYLSEYFGQQAAIRDASWRSDNAEALPTRRRTIEAVIEIRRRY